MRVMVEVPRQARFVRADHPRRSSAGGCLYGGAAFVCLGIGGAYSSKRLWLVAVLIVGIPAQEFGANCLEFPECSLVGGSLGGGIGERVVHGQCLGATDKDSLIVGFRPVNKAMESS